MSGTYEKEMKVSHDFRPWTVVLTLECLKSENEIFDIKALWFAIKAETPLGDHYGASHLSRTRWNGVKRWTIMVSARRISNILQRTLSEQMTLRLRPDANDHDGLVVAKPHVVVVEPKAVLLVGVELPAEVEWLVCRLLLEDSDEGGLRRFLP